ncbi:unnamed protein product [Arabidopsis halleri]
MTKRKQHLSVVAYRSSGHPLFVVQITSCCSRPSLRLHRDPDKHLSLEATLHSSIATDYCKICPPINGLVCRQLRGNGCIFAVISNPITGEYVTTPKVKTEAYPSEEKIYFGYDPVEEQFKQSLTKNVPSFALML